MKKLLKEFCYELTVKLTILFVVTILIIFGIMAFKVEAAEDNNFEKKYQISPIVIN